jgi:Na+/H+-dicarboxylate symporter
LPESFIVMAVPLILPVDWALGRVRSAVNVMSDLLVAILLDRFRDFQKPCAPNAGAELRDSAC